MPCAHFPPYPPTNARLPCHPLPCLFSFSCTCSITEHVQVLPTPRRHEQHQQRPGHSCVHNLPQRPQPLQGHVLRGPIRPTDNGERLPSDAALLRLGIDRENEVRMGSPACNSTCCNPAADLPINCNNKITPHLHHDYDMVPTFFTVIQSHMAIDCGPHNNDGVQIPSAISIGTKVCTFTSTRFTPGTTSKNSVPLRRTILQRTTQWVHATFRDRLGLLLGLCHISIPAVCLAFQYLCLPPYHPTPTSGYTSRLSTASWYW